jgi:hypothetical protein
MFPVDSNSTNVITPNSKTRTNRITTSQQMNHFSNARSLTLIQNVNCCVNRSNIQQQVTVSVGLWKGILYQEGGNKLCSVFIVLPAIELACLVYRFVCTVLELGRWGGQGVRGSEGQRVLMVKHKHWAYSKHNFLSFFRVSFVRSRVWKLEPVPLSFADRNSCSSTLWVSGRRKAGCRLQCRR